MAQKAAVDFVRQAIKQRAIAQMPKLSRIDDVPPNFQIQKPAWALPLLKPARYKA